MRPSHLAQFTSFLASHGHFGLDARQVTLVPHTVAPPNLTENLSVVMASPEKVSRSQAGSGEVFLALRRCARAWAGAHTAVHSRAHARAGVSRVTTAHATPLWHRMCLGCYPPRLVSRLLVGLVHVGCCARSNGARHIL